MASWSHPLSTCMTSILDGQLGEPVHGVETKHSTILAFCDGDKKDDEAMNDSELHSERRMMRQ